MDRARNMKKPSPKSNALEARTFKLQHELPTFWWTTETSLYFVKKLEQLFTCVFKNGSFTASSKSGSNWSAAIPRSAWSVDVENGTFFGPFLASWGHHIPRGLRCRPVNFLTSCEKKTWDSAGKLWRWQSAWNCCVSRKHHGIGEVNPCVSCNSSLIPNLIKTVLLVVPLGGGRILGFSNLSNHMVFFTSGKFWSPEVTFSLDMAASDSKLHLSQDTSCLTKGVGDAKQNASISTPQMSRSHTEVLQVWLPLMRAA